MNFATFRQRSISWRFGSLNCDLESVVFDRKMPSEIIFNGEKLIFRSNELNSVVPMKKDNFGVALLQKEKDGMIYTCTNFILPISQF